ncbi:PIR Superfamily Protein [Plasmodium ovale wallikeri]|uniref:PIR Superfamily Protein n=1 Tax=Plasmodium ovale wallikeri TaxID=864142 RepID=A0A1A9AK80_PLAOA|nr:PIR Superfamily Protein [Plasmodium ovale wallikeri]SBT56905.1 PIR Superfamily Protein [Plasmodium ovale wallikeri]
MGVGRIQVTYWGSNLDHEGKREFCIRKLADIQNHVDEEILKLSKTHEEALYYINCQELKEYIEDNEKKYAECFNGEFVTVGEDIKNSIKNAVKKCVNFVDDFNLTTMNKEELTSFIANEEKTKIEEGCKEGTVPQGKECKAKSELGEKSHEAEQGVELPDIDQKSKDAQETREGSASESLSHSQPQNDLQKAVRGTPHSESSPSGIVHTKETKQSVDSSFVQHETIGDDTHLISSPREIPENTLSPSGPFYMRDLEKISSLITDTFVSHTDAVAPAPPSDPSDGVSTETSANGRDQISGSPHVQDSGDSATEGHLTGQRQSASNLSPTRQSVSEEQSSPGDQKESMGLTSPSGEVSLGAHPVPGEQSESDQQPLASLHGSSNEGRQMDMEHSSALQTSHPNKESLEREAGKARERNGLFSQSQHDTQDHSLPSSTSFSENARDGTFSIVHNNHNHNYCDTTTLYNAHCLTVGVQTGARDMGTEDGNSSILDSELGGITIKTYITTGLSFLGFILLFIFLMRFTVLGRIFSRNKKKNRQIIQEELRRIMYSPSSLEEQNIYFSYDNSEYSQYDSQYYN